MKPKLIFVFILVLGIAIVGYKYFSKREELPYNWVLVEKGNIVQKVSATGRVIPAKKIDLQFEIQGKIKDIKVEVGQEVKAGTLLVKLDIKDAEKSVRDAEISLENAKLALEKLNLQHEQLLRGDTLNKNYEDGLRILANLYDGFSNTLDALDKIFFGKNLSETSQTNIEYYADYDSKLSDVPNRVERLYQEIKDLYQKAFSDYRLTKRGGGETREEAMKSGYELTVKTAETIKTGRDVIQALEDKLIEGDLTHSKEEIINQHASDLTNYATSINNYLKDLLAIINSINSYRDALSLYPLDKQNQELSIKQRENALFDAKEKLDDYSIFAPISGIVADIKKEEGEVVTIQESVISIISLGDFQIEVDIPEADVGKVSQQDPAEIILDAFPDYKFSGKVIKIEPAETIIQGVVYYKVTVGFDEPDERMKSGMTANVDIITETKENVLTVPQGAVLTKNSQKMVRILEGKDIKEVKVETGIRGSRGEIEILSGLKEGDQVITFLKEK
ncbi:hypothetical protein AUJ27_03350 [Candidatus Falkowbacteria bacterium CG1_02_37_44]|uniref:Membrane fusion protein biotin-lipoyl like domain-containing protein n=1 Tax=Candidatus Falkowbacteria bacterium CG1_02_37_44 TaxID=1805146 RepID=A0A1J4T7V6_9BACT|nr:MAG: hypothetical protein AUJ27_03350 [Candidatus Falkowbacteria bacterium CG1_02_37_44]